MENKYEIIGTVFGACVAVVWICFALLIGYWDIRVALAVSVSLTILFGTISGGFLATSKKNKKKAIN
jgi:hypothetical protein